jgi:hypothetical protein
VQIAKALGATVAATSSDVALLSSLGVDVPINYRDQDWGETLKGQVHVDPLARSYARFRMPLCALSGAVSHALWLTFDSPGLRYDLRYS